MNYYECCDFETSDSRDICEDCNYCEVCCENVNCATGKYKELNDDSIYEFYKEDGGF